MSGPFGKVSMLRSSRGVPKSGQAAPWGRGGLRFRPTPELY